MVRHERIFAYTPVFAISPEMNEGLMKLILVQKSFSLMGANRDKLNLMGRCSNFKVMRIFSKMDLWHEFEVVD